MIGVTQGAVSQWEKGLTHPRYATIPLLCTALGCTIEQLLGVDKGA